MTDSTTTSNVTLRIFQESDIPELVEVINQSMDSYGLSDRITPDEIRHWLTIPFVNAAEGFFVAVNADDKIVGTGINMFNHRTGRGFGIISALPAYPETKRQLIEAGDSHIQKRGAVEIAETEDRPVYIIRQAFTQQTDDIALLEIAGYSDNRHFYEMQIVFDGEIEAPTFPAGIEIHPFNPEQHASAVHQAQQEAFRDHWGHAEDVPFDEWKKRLEHPH
ncbi:MAG TPA: hypothetical protein VHL11_07815, partial [Phototrophicaceae bacterium]|nr:hypothetical protein [Phototrophicaceae bacterium]